VAEIRFHPEAEAEYGAARARYLARSEQAAARFEAEMGRALAFIESRPSTFPAYDDQFRCVMLRRFPFSVVYVIEPDFISVIALAHARRVPGYWKRRT
jgi:hypothetical protein